MGMPQNLPCPWNPDTGRTDGGEGGRLYVGYAALPNGGPDGKNEKMLVTSKTDIGGGNWELELMRWAACDDQLYYGHHKWWGIRELARYRLVSVYVGYGTVFGSCGLAGCHGSDGHVLSGYGFASHLTLGPAPNGLYATVAEGAVGAAGANTRAVQHAAPTSC